MTVCAKIIEDCLSPTGIRLTSFELHYPKFIHGEFMTHRVFNRSASSSRAIPVQTLIQQILLNPAEPEAWGANQKGMQAGQELTGARLAFVRAAWHGAKHAAVLAARLASWAGVHKQVVNRLIEPWSHISVIVTATDWKNFLALRNHPAADPTMQALARAIQREFDGSEPTELLPGQWHLPYVSMLEQAKYPPETLIKISAARCARVSYLTHDGATPSIEKDLALFDMLADAKPMHASPMEHQATPDHRWGNGRWSKPHLHGNLRGWKQFRKTLANEAVSE